MVSLAFNIFSEALVTLLLTLVKSCPEVCKNNHFHVLLGAYGATLSYTGKCFVVLLVVDVVCKKYIQCGHHVGLPQTAVKAENTQLSRMYLYSVELRFPFTGTFHRDEGIIFST